MSLLIDGYNLLHASGILPSPLGPVTLERARRALLNYLVSKLTPLEISSSTVVFDAQSAPAGLPSRINHQGLQVVFAAKHQEADDLIEELIRADSAPRRLTVVSSDHRIQRAARRRRSLAIDSEKWCRQIAQRSNQPVDSEVEASAEKPQLPMSQRELEQWLVVFGDIDLLSDDSALDSTAPTAAELLDKNNQCNAYKDADVDPLSEGLGEEVLEELDDDSIFPRGYGEDLLE